MNYTKLKEEVRIGLTAITVFVMSVVGTTAFVWWLSTP